MLFASDSECAYFIWSMRRVADERNSASRDW